MDFVSVKKLFSANYYAIPDYQRDYEWTSAQNLTLLDDIFSILINPDKNIKHFIGAIVTVPFEKSNGINKSINFEDYSISTDDVRHVVDGQQRLTSLSILIAVLNDLIENDEGMVNTKKNLVNVLTRMLLGDEVCQPDSYNAPRLILNANTGAYYNNNILHVRSESANKKYRGAKHISAIYNLYKQNISKQYQTYNSDGKYQNTNDFYKALVDVVTNRLILVEITCDESSNAFQVFDSLNGKGLDLTAADRIKNIMLSWAQPTDKAAQKWDSLVQLTSEEYLANYLIALFFFNCKERISKNKLPDKFREIYKDSAINNYTNFFETLKETAYIYGTLRSCKTKNKNVNEALRDLQQLGLNQIYVLIFAIVYHYKSIDIINKPDFVTFIKSLTALVVRMQICDMNMNSLDMLFKKCIKEMTEANADLSLINKIIEDRKKNAIPDNLFIEKFEQFSTSDDSLCNFYLRHIEDYKRQQKGIRNKAERELTVEHIIPQTLDDLSIWYGITPIPEEIEEDFNMNVIQNIGNKALLFGDDNTSAGNNNYINKINVYKTGKKGQNQGTPYDTFQLIKDLVDNYSTKFNHEEFFLRAKELAKYAAKIW